MKLTIEQLISVYQLKKGSETGCDNYSQSAVLSSCYELNSCLPDSFSDVEGWNDGPYRVVWVSDSERAIATYCEGDFSLTIAHSVEEYKKEIQQSHNFYVAEKGAIGFTCIPDEQPIAQQAIEEIPGINEQPWRQYHLFSERSHSYGKAIISDPDKTVVLAKAAEIMMINPDDFDSLKKAIGKEAPGHELRRLSLYLSYSGEGLWFNRCSLYEVLLSEAPEHFTDINDASAHIELKNWIWYYFSDTSDLYDDMPWMQGYKERDAKSKECVKADFDCFFDTWELEKQGGRKIEKPYSVRVIYYLAGQVFSYEGLVMGYRYVSNPDKTVRKQYVIQPDSRFPESCGYLVYWIERSRFTLL